MKKAYLVSFFLIFLICALFFYPIFQGKIPFPGDLLVGGVSPYKYNSYLGYAPGGFPNKAQGPDVIKELYPWKHFVIESLKKGNLPFWNPYNFSGNPLLANFQSGVFYPLNILFLPFSFDYGWTFFIFISVILASCFMFLFLKELKISNTVSIFAGVIFAFSSYMIVWLEYGNIGHTFLWLPLALIIVNRLVNKFRQKYFLLLFIVLFISFLAGYIQGWFYITLTIFLYYNIRSYQEKTFSFKNTLIFISIILLPLFFGAFQLIPTLELFSNSSRGNYSMQDIASLLNPWWYSITVIAPDFFGHPATRNHFFYGTYIERVSYFGIIPFIFALSFLVTKTRKEASPFKILFVITFLLSIDLFFNRYLYLLPIPIISTTVPTRILSLFIFSGIILFAYALDNFLKKGHSRQLTISIFFVALLIILAGIYSTFNHLDISLRNLFYPFVMLILFIIFLIVSRRFKKYQKIFLLFLIFITLFDLFRNFHKITPFSSADAIYPSTSVISYLQKNAGVYRYWGLGNAHFETNIQLYDHTYLPDGHDALHIKNYGELLSTTKNGQIEQLISRSDSEIYPASGPDDFLSNSYSQKMLNLLGVKYIITKDQIISSDKYKLLWQLDGWQVYENKNVARRYFLTNDYELITDKHKIIEKLYSQNFNHNKTIILTKNPLLEKKPLKQKTINLLKYEPNYQKYMTKTDADSLLFVSDTIYPGWSVKVDGQESTLYQANYAFRAAFVPSGNHTIEFIYYPDSFKKGLIISSVALVVLILFYTMTIL